MASRRGWVRGAAACVVAYAVVMLLVRFGPDADDRDARTGYTLWSGALVAVLVAVGALWVHARRNPGQRLIGRGRPSRAATVAALGSAFVALTIVGILGAAVASATLPVAPGGDYHAALTVTNHVFVPATLVLFVVPSLGAVALLVAQAAEDPPRGLGALPVGLAHAAFAALVAGVGSGSAPRAVALSLALAAPPAAAAVAYVMLFVAAVRTPFSKRP